jgi:hypothetical protein
MEEPPRIPQVMYSPDLVADAILFAAEHPKRQIYVGGSGFTQSLIASLFPRLTDRVMELALVRFQQSETDGGDPAMRDNLYEPKKDGLIEGTQQFRVKRWSLSLQAQKHPLAAAAIFGGAAAAAGLALSRTRGKPRPLAAT